MMTPRLDVYPELSEKDRKAQMQRDRREDPDYVVEEKAKRKVNEKKKMAQDDKTVAEFGRSLPTLQEQKQDILEYFKTFDDYYNIDIRAMSGFLGPNRFVIIVSCRAAMAARAAAAAATTPPAVAAPPSVTAAAASASSV